MWPSLGGQLAHVSRSDFHALEEKKLFPLHTFADVQKPITTWNIETACRAGQVLLWDFILVTLKKFNEQSGWRHIWKLPDGWLVRLREDSRWGYQHHLTWWRALAVVLKRGRLGPDHHHTAFRHLCLGSLKIRLLTWSSDGVLRVRHPTSALTTWQSPWRFLTASAHHASLASLTSAYCFFIQQRHCGNCEAQHPRQRDLTKIKLTFPCCCHTGKERINWSGPRLPPMWFLLGSYTELHIDKWLVEGISRVQGQVWIEKCVPWLYCNKQTVL